MASAYACNFSIISDIVGKTEVLCVDLNNEQTNRALMFREEFDKSWGNSIYCEIANASKSVKIYVTRACTQDYWKVRSDGIYYSTSKAESSFRKTFDWGHIDTE